MKNFKKFTVWICITALLLTVPLSACGKKKKGGDEPVFDLGPSVPGGAHEDNSTETDEFIIENRASGYKIVYPAAGYSRELTAADELVRALFDATDTVFERVPDTGLPFGADSKYISVGNTSLSSAADIAAGAALLGDKGFVIKTVHRSVFIKGFTDLGTLYGAYEFLYKTIGYETFGPGNSVYKKVSNVKLFEYDITEVPDITYNIQGTGLASENLDKQRFSKLGGSFIAVEGNEWHNVFDYLPPEQYMAAHREWYSNLGDQLCYLAQGDPESLSLMIATSLEAMKKELIRDRTGTRITFSMMDSESACKCTVCRASADKYDGSSAATIIQFLNRLNKEVKAWFLTEDGKPYSRDLDLCFFAYHENEKPPVRLNKESGKYEPIDQSVVMDDEVCAWLAPITPVYNKSFYAPENQSTYENLMGWSAISKKLYMWTYSTNFHYYLAPFNSFAAMGGMYKALVEAKTFYLFDQNQFNAPNSTGFTVLKAYLSSKLAWNANQSMEELIDRFFANHYGEAGALMKECFELLRSQFAYNENVLGFNGGDIYLNPLKKDIWPQTFLERCIGLIDEAKAVAARTEPDAKERKRITDAAATESLSFRYLLIQLYGGQYRESVLMEMKRAFKTDALAVNVIRQAEKDDIQGLFDAWGV